MILLITLAALRCGNLDRTSAAAPVTSGAAKLVPCTRQYPPGRAPIRLTAGALSTVCGPVRQPDQSWSGPTGSLGWSSHTLPVGEVVGACSPVTATTPASRAG